MVNTNQSDTNREGKYLSRRRVLQTTGLAVSATSCFGYFGSTPAKADEVKQTHGSDTATDPDYDADTAVSGMEVSAAGPDDSNTTYVEEAVCCGFNPDEWEDSENDRDYFVEYPYIEFEFYDGPSDCSVDDMAGYIQGDSDNQLPKEVEYALDMMWELSNVPAPSPVDLVQESGGVDITTLQDQDGFRAEWDEVLKYEGMCGVFFNIAFGSDGACATGDYTFRVESGGDVTRHCGGAGCGTTKVDEHYEVEYFTITLTDC